jgi:hypothetical protein
VHEATLSGEVTYLEAVIKLKDGIDARFIFLGPTCMLDVQVRALKEGLDLESIRRSLMAVEWR